MALNIFGGNTGRAAAGLGAQLLAQRFFAPTDREITSPLRNPQITQGLQRFSPTGFASPGLTGSFQDGNFNLARNPLFSESFGGLTNAFQTNADFIRSDLLPQVEPGVGGLTQARLGEIENRRRRSIGNLRENLSRRRVLGSSFATDALARADAEFAKEAAEAKAQGFLQELDLKTKLSERAFELERQKFQTNLDQLNFEGELAANVSAAATKAEAANTTALSELLANLATQEAGLLAQSAQGTGRFLGQLFGEGGVLGQGGAVGKLVDALSENRGILSNERFSALRNEIEAGTGRIASNVQGLTEEQARRFAQLNEIEAGTGRVASLLGSGGAAASGLTAGGTVGASGLAALGHPALAASAAQGGSLGLAASGPLGAGLGGGATPATLAGLEAAAGAGAAGAAGAAQFAGTGGFALPGGGILAGQGSLGLTGSGAPALTSTLPAGTTVAGGGLGAGIAAGAAVAIPALVISGIINTLKKGRTRDKARSQFRQQLSQTPTTTINGATGKAFQWPGGGTFLASPDGSLVFDPKSQEIMNIDFLKGVIGPSGFSVGTQKTVKGVEEPTRPFLKSTISGIEQKIKEAERVFGVTPTGTLKRLAAAQKRVIDRQKQFDSATTIGKGGLREVDKATQRAALMGISRRKFVRDSARGN